MPLQKSTLYLYKPCMALLTLLLFATYCFAQQEKEREIIQQLTTPNTSAKADYYLIKIEDSTSVAELQKNKLLVRQINQNLFIIAAKDKARISSTLLLPANNNWKLSPPLLQNRTNLKKGKSSLHTYHLIVNSIPDFHQWLQSKQAAVQTIQPYPELNMVTVKTSEELFFSLLITAPMVLYAESGERLPKEEGIVYDNDPTLNRINTAHYFYPSVNGNGLIASVKEDLFDTTDIDFKGRYVPALTASRKSSNHATTMATLIGGGGNNAPASKGVAWGSSLSSSAFGNLFPDADSIYRRYGITVQNHSYGTAIENFYGADALAYDKNMHDHPTIVHVFSAGNSGSGTSNSGVYQGVNGYANLTGSFKMSKNSIVVTAVDSFASPLPFISKGPAYDGRLKPELAAFSKDGSSGSAALTTGSILLLQQLYRAKYSQLPRASLVKAVLINTADDAGRKGIDFNTGYGSINVLKAMQAIEKKNFFEADVQQNETKTFAVTIPANTFQLKVTLCWTDLPTSANNATALLNDLDLSLKHLQTGKIYLPWVLNSSPHVDSLQLLPVRKRDSLNNTEQVSIDLPEEGTYEISIKGNKVAGKQLFDIAYHQETINTFEWNFPIHNDNILPNQQAVLRWNNTFSTTGHLQWSADGLIWHTIDNNADLSKNYSKWHTPDTVTLARLRMLIGNQAFLTDTFSIIQPNAVTTGFNCTDSSLLLWNKQKGIFSYQLYTLGTHYLEPYSQTTDTSFIWRKQANSSPYYAVAPIFNSSRTALKSITVKANAAEAGCYLKSFTINPEGRKANIIVELGTTYQVKKILIEKQTGTSFTTLTSLQPGSKEFNYLDTLPGKGATTYRVRIILNNDQEIISPGQTIHFTDYSEYALFPNPAEPYQWMRVNTSRSNNSQLILYTITGQKIFEKALGSNSTFQLPFLTKGLYLYVLYENGNKIHTGKLLIR